MVTVKCSDFVKRQTKNSGYSHFEGSWKELEDLTERYFNKYAGLFVRPGYRDGVMLVDLPGWRFKSAIIKIDKDTQLNSKYVFRSNGEESYIKTSAKAEKQIANYATVVLYRADVLLEDNDRSSDADWEIVAIKARMTFTDEPMSPYTMARNFLHLSGGTQGNFTATEFAKSILYWNNHCLCASKYPLWKRIWKWINHKFSNTNFRLNILK